MLILAVTSFCNFYNSYLNLWQSSFMDNCACLFQNNIWMKIDLLLSVSSFPVCHSCMKWKWFANCVLNTLKFPIHFPSFIDLFVSITHAEAILVGHHTHNVDFKMGLTLGYVLPEMLNIVNLYYFRNITPPVVICVVW